MQNQENKDARFISISTHAHHAHRAYMRRKKRKARHSESEELPSSAPSNTVQPQASTQPEGDPSVGSTAETDNGTWDNEPTSYTYQWQLDGIDIVGATFRTILIVAGMVGSVLRCVVRATNQIGFAAAFSTTLVITL